MLMVFSQLDEDQNGIVTESEFIGSMVELGCTTEEAHSYFNRCNAPWNRRVWSVIAIGDSQVVCGDHVSG